MSKSPPSSSLQALSFPVVGIGASAGGLEAFSALLAALPPRPGVALVFVQHLESGHASALAELLGRVTALPVVQAKRGMKVAADCVYAIPPGVDMTIDGGVLRLARRRPGGVHMPVDRFLASLAADQGSNAVGVILSGSGADGATGLRDVRAQGGVTFVQDDSSARHASMPQRAGAAGVVDYALPPAAIARELALIGAARRDQRGRRPVVNAGEISAVALRAILDATHAATGIDFSPYRATMLVRRVLRRMALRHVTDAHEYSRYVGKHAAEAQALHDDFLISVTHFFRQPETLNAITRRILPRLLKERSPGRDLRVWVPGCATGEEAYSLAMCLLEGVGGGPAVQLYGTDLSAAAVQRARTGVYPPGIAADVSKARLTRFFRRVADGFEIGRAARNVCTFARHDLMRDPPFSDLDLVSCCNVLIYFEPDAQRRILRMFHYALRPDGFLVLGRAESAAAAEGLFTVADRESGIYAPRKPMPAPPRRAALRCTWETATGGSGVAKLAVLPPVDVQLAADRVLRRHAPSAIVVNDRLEIVHFAGDVAPYLRPSTGTASLSLLKMAPGTLAVELRAAVRASMKSGRPVRRAGLVVESAAGTTSVAAVVTPIVSAGGGRAWVIVFEQPTTPSRPQRASAGRPRTRHAARLTDELHVAREQLQTALREHETANELLRAANDQVSLANEQLRALNEELETAKEELQATNEELTTLNDEYRQRNTELVTLNDDLTNLLASVNLPIVILGRDQRIRRFTAACRGTLGLLSTDIGRRWSDVDGLFEIPDLAVRLRAGRGGATPEVARVIDGRGRPHTIRVKAYRDQEGAVQGLVVALVTSGRDSGTEAPVPPLARSAR